MTYNEFIKAVKAAITAAHDKGYGTAICYHLTHQDLAKHDQHRIRLEAAIELALGLHCFLPEALQHLDDYFELWDPWDAEESRLNIRLQWLDSQKDPE